MKELSILTDMRPSGSVRAIQLGQGVPFLPVLQLPLGFSLDPRSFAERFHTHLLSASSACHAFWDQSIACSPRRRRSHLKLPVERSALVVPVKSDDQDLRSPESGTLALSG